MVVAVRHPCVRSGIPASEGVPGTGGGHGAPLTVVRVVWWQVVAVNLLSGRFVSAFTSECAF